MAAVFNDLAATIANGASLSGAVNLGNGGLAAIVMPSAWTAAVLTFQGSSDGTNFYNLYDDTGSEITATVSTSRIVALQPSLFAGLRYVKVRSGTSGAAVNQGGERALVLLTRQAPR
jgi:hypothetical protein